MSAYLTFDDYIDSLRHSTGALPSMSLTNADSDLCGTAGTTPTRQRAARDTVVRATLRSHDAVWTLKSAPSHTRSTQHLLSWEPVSGLMLPPGSMPADQTSSPSMPVTRSGLAYYRLKRAGPAPSDAVQEGEFDVMLPMKLMGSDPLPHAGTYPVVWDTSSLDDTRGWWGDIPASDFKLTRFADGSPDSLSVVSKEDGGSGVLPEGNFHLEHRTDLVGYDPVNPEQPISGNRIIAGPIFLKAGMGGENYDARYGSTHGQGTVQFFTHPSPPTGRRWYTPEEEASLWP